MTTPTFTLGQQVKFAETLKRRMTYDKQAIGKAHGRRWDSGTQWAPVERIGVVVGRRTLSNGYVNQGYYDEPTTYHGVHTFTAYLVAFDLRRKPVLVLPEHITAVSL